jgi:hypothetical protein
MTETIIDVCLRFPGPKTTPSDRILDLAHTEEGFQELHKFCGSVEQIECDFHVEFACGDDPTWPHYFSNFWKWTENEGALVAVVPYEIMAKFDGKFCLTVPPLDYGNQRDFDTKQPLETEKDYRFVVKHDHEQQTYEFYINGRFRSEKAID